MVIERCPYFDRTTHIEVPDGLGTTQVDVHSYQLIVWITVVPIGVERCPSRSPRIPAIVDTGFNGNLLISEAQLVAWQHLDFKTYLRSRSRVNGEEIPHIEANLFLHPNKPGTRSTPHAKQSPELLELYGGVGVVAKGHLVARRLPLLGIAALTTNGYALHVTPAMSKKDYHKFSLTRQA